MARIVGLMLLAVLSACFSVRGYAYGTTLGIKVDALCSNNLSKTYPSYNTGCYTKSDALSMDMPVAAASWCSGGGWKTCPYTAPVAGTSAGCLEPTTTGGQDCNISFKVQKNDGSTLTTTLTLSYAITKKAIYKCDPPLLTTDAGCTCPVGQLPDGTGACVPYTCPAAGSVLPGSEFATYSMAIGDLSEVACVSGCLVTSAFTVGFKDETGSMVYQMAGPLRTTGTVCNPSGQGGTAPSLGAAQPSQQAASAPAPCSAGLCPGTVNGTAVCKACDKVSTGNVTVKPGEASTITQTDCSGGTCTTKTGTVDASGNVTWTGYTVGSGQNAANTGAGGTDATSGGGGGGPQKTDDFCATNPNSIICKTSTFGGSCGTFSCSGDSVQCAIAKDQHDRNCQLFDTPTELSDKGVAAVAAGASGVSSVGVSDVSLDFASKLDQQDRLPGACPGDRVVPVLKGSITIPFSKVCELAGILSKALIAFSMLAAAFIVFRQRA